MILNSSDLEISKDDFFKGVYSFSSQCVLDGAECIPSVELPTGDSLLLSVAEGPLREPLR